MSLSWPPQALHIGCIELWPLIRKGLLSSHLYTPTIVNKDRKEEYSDEKLVDCFVE